MDRRVLIVLLILFAGGATGVGVALFAFVGLDDATADTEVVWDADPAHGDDGSGAVVATVDGDPLIVQPAGAEALAVDDTNEADRDGLRALDADGDVAWTHSLPDGVSAAETSGLVAGDFNGESVVAFTTDAGELVVVNAANGEERFVVELDDAAGLEPAFVDLTDDGETELVAVTADGTLLAVDTDGDEVLETALDGSPALEPLAVTGDPEADAVSGTLTSAGVAVLTDDADGQRVSVVDGDGDVVWSEPTETTALSWNAADTRRGGIVALGGVDGTLTTLEVADGASRYSVGLQDAPVDVGGADAGRIHVGGTGDLWAVDLLDGEVVWKQQYGGENRVNAPAVGDVTGDGDEEIVVVNRGGGVLGTNSGGEAVLRGGLDDTIVYATPLLADVTGDGGNEVVIVTEDGRVVVLGV
ncbi:hypothetical protein JCM17823_26130 [Halorubrum gandharaense]